MQATPRLSPARELHDARVGDCPPAGRAGGKLRGRALGTCTRIPRSLAPSAFHKPRGFVGWFVMESPGLPPADDCQRLTVSCPLLTVEPPPPMLNRQLLTVDGRPMTSRCGRLSQGYSMIKGQCFVPAHRRGMAPISEDGVRRVALVAGSGRRLSREAELKRMRLPWRAPAASDIRPCAGRRWRLRSSGQPRSGRAPGQRCMACGVEDGSPPSSRRLQKGCTYPWGRFTATPPPSPAPNICLEMTRPTAVFPIRNPLALCCVAHIRCGVERPPTFTVKEMTGCEALPAPAWGGG